jgi:hypothetical protein
MSRRGLIWASGAALATIGVFAAAILVVVIVQGDDDSYDLGSIPVPEGRVSCEAFGKVYSYRYTARTTLDLEERTPDMDPEGDPYREAEFVYTQIIEGAYQGGGYDSVISAEPVGSSERPAPIIVVGDMYYVFINNAWNAHPISDAPSFPIPYLPSDTCASVAPDIFLDQADSVTEEAVAGVAAKKYHFEDFPTELPARHPSFGGQSDAARLIDSFGGDIWVADEGGYIIKIDIVGVGAHPNGRELTVSISYDLSAVNDRSIRVAAPGGG